MSDTRAFLLAHAAAYPALTLTDLFKALYQSAFGCEHLVADPSAAEAYIAAEAEGARPCGRKSVEPLDGPYIRVHLEVLKKGLSAERWRACSPFPPSIGTARRPNLKKSSPC